MMNRQNKFGMELGEILEMNHISIKEYADRIGTTSKNLIDIIEGRVSLSFNMVCNIAFISDIPVSYIMNVEENFKLDKNIDLYIEKNNMTLRECINRFHYKELSEKYDVIYQNEKNDYSILRGILKYLRILDPTILMKDNHIFYKSKNDKPELLALWLERCYRVVQEQELGQYQKENIQVLVEFIREEARHNRFDKNKLIQKFNENGIFLAIEPDLKGAKIRGAFRVLNDKPAIYLTTKHKRYADVYFALLHELAHCQRDFNRGKSGSIVSLENYASESDYEIKADELAFRWMVDDKVYQEFIQNLRFDREDIIPSFAVYRLAHDKYISYQSEEYQKYNKIIE